MPEVTIRTRTDGPLVVEGDFRLVDSQHNPFPLELGEKKGIALCRCGASVKRPFCDGAHRQCGFESDERAPAG
jgi:CDGSH-type Zn-finger protein